MQMLYPDVALSKVFAEQFKQLVKPKACYDNVAEIVLNFSAIENEYPGIRVVFGGVQALKGEELFARHCFFKLEDKVIDPTFALKNTFSKNTRYIPLVSFSMEEYKDMLAKWLNTSPDFIMKIMDKEAIRLWKEQEIGLIG